MSELKISPPSSKLYQFKLQKISPQIYNLPNPNQQLVEIAEKKLLEVMQGKILTLDNITEFLKVALSIVSHLKRGQESLTSEEIKCIIIEIIKKQIETLPMEEDNKQFLTEIFVPLLMPGIIDGLMIDVQKLISQGCCWSFCGSRSN